MPMNIKIQILNQTILMQYSNDINFFFVRGIVTQNVLVNGQWAIRAAQIMIAHLM
jgi:hypothetical protein